VIGAFAGCVAVLVHSLFDFVLHTTAITLLFLMLLALVVAAGRSYADDPEDEGRSHRRKRGSGTVTRMPDGKLIAGEQS
jgi:hypothetical protein